MHTTSYGLTLGLQGFGEISLTFLCVSYYIEDLLLAHYLLDAVCKRGKLQVQNGYK